MRYNVPIITIWNGSWSSDLQVQDSRQCRDLYASCRFERKSECLSSSNFLFLLHIAMYQPLKSSCLRIFRVSYFTQKVPQYPSECVFNNTQPTLYHHSHSVPLQLQISPSIDTFTSSRSSARKPFLPCLCYGDAEH
jgi:hypothetical protein